MATGLGDLRAAVAALAAFDPAALPSVALAEQVVELRQLIDGLEGTWSRLVAVLDGSGTAEGGTSAFLRSSCRLAPAAARARVVLARRLTERPAVDAALTAGEISVDHARIVTHALEELAATDSTLTADAEAPLLAAARQLDPARLRREIAHARHALAPEAAAVDDETKHSRRHLDVATTFEGMVAVNGLLSPEGGDLLMTALTPLSGPVGPDDTRTPGQRRADALADLCHHGLDHAGLPTVSGERPHLTVLVPLPALTRPPTTGIPTLSRLTATPTNAAALTDIPDPLDASPPSDSGPTGIPRQPRSARLTSVADPTAPPGIPQPTGTTSPTGSFGSTDAPGPTGRPRSTDVPGPTGSAGPTCTPRPTQAPGPTESGGPTGTPRSTDVPGPTGSGGPAGVPGPTGARCPIGVPSPTGNPGPTGVSGPTGAPDPIGVPSPTGTPGPIGVPDHGSPANSAGSGVAVDQPGWWGGLGRSVDAVTGEATWGAVLGPHAVQRIACDASVVRVVLDPAGQPLDVGRRTRVVPPAIRTALTVRDRGCAYPGCDRGPQWTDAHHIRHWANGGPTSLDNLILLCRHHHRAVHEGRVLLPHAPPRAA